MRHITKGEPPASFTAWKEKANEEWQPSFDNLQNPEKHDLRLALLREQGEVCCYCGCEIDEENSHIEHFRPQSRYPDQALAYENLYLSCLREVNPGAPLHCGHAKRNHFEENLVLSLLAADCERRFSYHLTGEIFPKDGNDAKAAYMCELLKLDIALLRYQRAATLDKVFDPDFLAGATDDDLQKLRQAFHARDIAGKYVPFGHVVARFAEQLMA